MHKIISNTTPIITLLTISKLELLRDIYSKIIIPEGVFQEIEEGKNKHFYKDLSRIDWIEIKSITDKKTLKYINDLDKGEAEVIVLANEIKADLVIIDEKAGREYAEHFGLKLTGTIGILLKAKQIGLIDKIQPLLTIMRENGIWLNQKFINQVLKIANE
jgi:predicted nucleic acid-binding protein